MTQHECCTFHTGGPISAQPKWIKDAWHFHSLFSHPTFSPIIPKSNNQTHTQSISFHVQSFSSCFGSSTTAFATKRHPLIWQFFGGFGGPSIDSIAQIDAKTPGPFSAWKWSCIFSICSFNLLVLSLGFQKPLFLRSLMEEPLFSVGIFPTKIGQPLF